MAGFRTSLPKRNMASVPPSKSATEHASQGGYLPFDQLVDVPVDSRRDARLPRLKFQPRHALVEALPAEDRTSINNVLVFVQDTRASELRKLKEYADTLSCPLEGSTKLLQDGKRLRRLFQSLHNSASFTHLRVLLQVSTSFHGAMSSSAVRWGCRIAGSVMSWRLSFRPSESTSRNPVVLCGRRRFCFR